MQVVYSPEHARHDAEHEANFGQRVGLYERPIRAEEIRSALVADDDFTLVAPTEHGLDPILAVHDPDLVAYLEVAWRDFHAEAPDEREAFPDSYLHPALREGMQPGRAPATGKGRIGYWSWDTATPLVEGTYAAARAAVDVALTAASLVVDGGAPSAYALCRPPGHHAPRAAFGGYCFFNNAAIAAEWTVRERGVKVTVLDVDYHHGNGIQQIFYNRPDVQYVSLHGDPDRAYPYFVGFADEVGSGKGLGTNLNLPLPEKCDDERFLTELERALDAVDRFDPALVVVSLGVDTYGQDPIGDFALTRESYPAAGAAVAALGRPMLIVQEGGYYVPDLGQNVRSWLRGAAGLPA
jgi:acetoin utilization deacetylase AcuC-like enzyme